VFPGSPFGERSNTIVQENPSQQNPSPIFILRLGRVIEKTGLSRATIYAYIGRGISPAPISLGERSVGWVDSEVDQWLESRIALRG
jgi:prophage regulatory protein